MGLEEFLPTEMQSGSLSACAKRVERSAAWQATRRDGRDRGISYT